MYASDSVFLATRRGLVGWRNYEDGAPEFEAGTCNWGPHQPGSLPHTSYHTSLTSSACATRHTLPGDVARAPEDSPLVSVAFISPWPSRSALGMCSRSASSRIACIETVGECTGRTVVAYITTLDCARVRFGGRLARLVTSADISTQVATRLANTRRWRRNRAA